jgi:hypothetical protein
VLAAVVLPSRAVRADSDKAAYWVEPMKKVHARFTGTRGTFAQFGDSITVTMAFWAPLRDDPKHLSTEMAGALKLVKGFMKPECWDKWKGPGYGSEGGMTIRWADENVDRWLKDHNPETALIMFGTNDLGQLDLKQYRQKTAGVVDRCLKNGTVVILSTIPPRAGMLDKSKKFAEAVREIAREKKVPLVDYFDAVLRRRPDDWDGSLAKFKKSPGDEYQVPTLISRDGVHPSYPSRYRDYSEASLRKSGYALRNYATLMVYADVVRKVLQPRGKTTQ